MKIIKCAILAFLGFLIYSNTLHAPFILDDGWFIVKNYQIRDISNFLKDFSGTRYIGLLSFAINYYFGGLNTFGYHIVNIIIHIINAILVYFLVILTFETIRNPQSAIHNQNFIAFAVSLVFLVHPIQTQAVTYMVQRFELLATFFCLLALVLYIKARINTMLNFKCLMLNNSKFKIKHLTLYFLSILSAILAMKTKERSFTLPFIIILYEFTFFNSNNLRTRFLYLIPYLLTLAIIPLEMFPSSMNPVSQGLEYTLQEGLTADSLTYNRLITQFNVVIAYVRLLVLPVDQHLFYDYHIIPKSIFGIKTFLSFVFLLLAIGLAIYAYLKSLKTGNIYGLLTAVGFFWFFITMSLNLIISIGVIFEHWLYLPSIGFFLSATAAAFYGFNYLEKKTGRHLYNYLLFIIIVIAAILSLSAYKRNNLWGDTYLMWLDNVNKAPNRAEPHNELGLEYYSQGRTDDAVKEYMTALGLKPTYSKAYNNLGLVYFEQGRLDEAIEEYLTALELNLNYEDARNNLGNVYSKQERLDKAVKEYLTVLELNPYHMDAHYNLGNAYNKQGRFDEAIKEYLTALKLNPNYADAHNNLGIVYSKQGRFNEAINEYLDCTKLKPDYVPAHYNLGNAYNKQGRFDEAIKEYLTALKIAPDYEPLHANIGSAYANKGLLDEAVKEYLLALKFKPDDADIHYNLGNVYYSKGQMDEAEKEYITTLRLNPNDAHAYYKLGNIHKAKGLKGEARREFETALKLKPDFIEAKETIESLK